MDSELNAIKDPQTTEVISQNGIDKSSLDQFSHYLDKSQTSKATAPKSSWVTFYSRNNLLWGDCSGLVVYNWLGNQELHSSNLGMREFKNMFNSKFFCCQLFFPSLIVLRDVDPISIGMDFDEQKFKTYPMWPESMYRRQKKKRISRAL